jgi:hypothetical protein
MRLIPHDVSSARRRAFSLPLVEFVLEPEPDPGEREAVAVALERLLAREQVPTPYRSAWRRLGIAENVASGYATARPRNSPGATRA